MIEKLYKKLFPILSLIPPETAHSLAIKFLSGIKYKDTVDDPILKTSLSKLKFKNPIGIAAGFDKDGKAFKGLLNLGFGFVEVGTVTLYPQDGNLKPRIFRLSEDEALINRLGFNNEGSKRVLERIKSNSKRKLDMVKNSLEFCSIIRQ